MFFNNYQLQRNNDEYTLVIYLPKDTEFANEFNENSQPENEGLAQHITSFIQDRFPNLKVTAVKILVGSTLISSFAIAPIKAEASGYTSYTNYTVRAGDSLWKIANQFGTTISAIKAANNMTADSIYVGQTLRIPVAQQAPQQTTSDIQVVINGQQQSFSPGPVIVDGSTYLPIRQLAESLGGYVWYNSESKTVGINKGDTRIAFVIGSTTARVNGELVSTQPSKVINGTTYVPVRFVSQAFGMNVSWDGNTRTVYVTNPTPTTYRVSAGDSLWGIATRFDTSVATLKEINNLTTDNIYVGQELLIPARQIQAPSAPAPAPEQSYTEPTVTYINHTVESGDNIWNLSIQYGVPQQEILNANNFTTSTMLSIGQNVRIPVHHIPVKPTVSDRHGELLDWWTEAQYVFSIGKVAKVTDFETGGSFYVKRTIGANHADTEPLTAQDAAIMKELWGGSYSWDKRAIIVEVDGRRIAASMTSMPHDIQHITDNNYNGHFDIHFLNSTRHKDGQITETHQEQIKVAAGVS